MDNQIKPNSGSLWTTPIEKVSKTTGRAYVKYTGSAGIDCPHCGHHTAYFLDAFLNSTKTGKQVYNISFTQDKRTDNGGQAAAQPEDFDFSGFPS